MQQKLLGGETSAYPSFSYFGGKQHLIPFLRRHLPHQPSRIIDGFSGSGIISYYFKQMGWDTLSCDILAYAHHTAQALVVNNGVRLTSGDVDRLFQPTTSASRQMHILYSNLFFTPSECDQFDAIRANIDSFSLMKQSLIFTIIGQVMLRKVAFHHFANLMTMRFRESKERIQRNPSLTRTIETEFREIYPSFNNAVFHGIRPVEAYRGDIRELILDMKADVAYFDPPYVGAHPDYEAFYHVLETFIERWAEKEFRHQTRQYYPKRGSGFVQKKEALNSFRALFEKTQHIPLVLISYNSTSNPTLDDLCNIIGEFRPYKVSAWVYNSANGGKGSKKGTAEYLIVAR